MSVVIVIKHIFKIKYVINQQLFPDFIYYWRWYRQTCTYIDTCVCAHARMHALLVFNCPIFHGHGQARKVSYQLDALLMSNWVSNHWTHRQWRSTNTSNWRASPNKPDTKDSLEQLTAYCGIETLHGGPHACGAATSRHVLGWNWKQCISGGESWLATASTSSTPSQPWATPQAMSM